MEPVKRKRGRPSKKDLIERAKLAGLVAEVDLATFNPLKILASIAADLAAPHAARVSAAKAYALLRPGVIQEDGRYGTVQPVEDRDKILGMALDILDRGSRRRLQ